MIPLRHIKPSDVEAWLERTCGSAGVAHRNDVLSVMRTVFDLAVERRHHCAYHRLPG